MEKEEEKILENLKSMWQSEQASISDLERESTRSILEHSRLHRPTQYRHQRNVRRWVLVVLLMILAVCIMVMIHWWIFLPIGWLAVLVGIELLSLASAVEVGQELYLLHKGSVESDSAVVTKTIAQLNRNAERRVHRFRFFINSSSPVASYSLRWGRIVGVGLSFAVVAVVAIRFTQMPKENPDIIIVKSTTSQPIVEPTPIEVKDTITVIPQQELKYAVVKEPRLEKRARIHDDTMSETSRSSPVAVQIAHRDTLPEEPIYMEIESEYNTTIKVRCNKSYLAEEVTGNDEEILERNS